MVSLAFTYNLRGPIFVVASGFVPGGLFLRESKYHGTLENFSVLVSRNCEHLIAEDETTSLSMPN